LGFVVVRNFLQDLLEFVSEFFEVSFPLSHGQFEFDDLVAKVREPIWKLLVRASICPGVDVLLEAVPIVASLTTEG